MHHDTALIATIAGGIGLAFVLGLAAARLRLPPLVGYLLAGILIGPVTPGFVADTGLAQQLSEIGVILLMFGVGIHFSLADLMAVRRIAVPGAIAQIVIATALGAAVAHLWGWSWGSGIVFGVCLSVASTVVLLRTMEDRGMLDSVNGQIAVGWLVVEDLATVMVLVVLPAVAVMLGGKAGAGPTPHLAVVIGLMLVKLTAFLALVLVIGRRLVPWLLIRIARLGSRELFTLSVLAIALGIAVGAAVVFDVSFALGAFLAGVVVSGSDLSHEAARDALPLQDAFSVLFFVSVGMLFDPAILLSQPLELAMVVGIVMLGKSLGAFFIVLGFRYPVRTAFTISASLAQIGEFSFILAALAVSLELLPLEGQSLIVAGAILSITLNPLAFWFSERASRWVADHPRLHAVLERSPRELGEVPAAAGAPPLRAHAIIVGYGRVGGAIGEAFAAQGIAYIGIDQNLQRVEALRAQGLPVIFGDATRKETLALASVEHARLLVAAVPDPFQVRVLIERARAANPALATVARTHSEDARRYLERAGVGLALIGEHELALGLTLHSLRAMGCDEARASDAVEALRQTPDAAAPPVT